MTVPSISIVVTGRNDNYGGDFNERFFSALQFNLDRLCEHRVSCEVVLVEWNPVAGRRFLCELLTEHVRVGAGTSLTRIVVAREYHAAMTQNPRLDYLEYVAKNVGIRRASAPWILATNTDVLFGRTVVEALARGELSAGTVYRASRYDIKLGADQSHLAWDALEDPSNHVRQPVLRPPLFSGGSGDFALARRETMHALRGYNEVYRAARVGIDLNFLVKAYGAGCTLVDIGGPVYHINHVGSLRISKAMYRDKPAESPWGDLRWHSRHVTYNNPDNWGLSDAPSRTLDDGSTYLDFEWAAVPPLLELRRIVLPVRTHS